MPPSRFHGGIPLRIHLGHVLLALRFPCRLLPLPLGAVALPLALLLRPSEEAQLLRLCRCLAGVSGLDLWQRLKSALRLPVVLAHGLVLGLAALDASGNAQVLNALGVAGLEIAQRLPTAAQHGAAIQLALVVQRHDHGLNVGGLLVKMKHSGHYPVAVLLAQPVHGRGFPAGKPLLVPCPGCAGIIWPEVFRAGTHDHLEREHRVLADGLIADLLADNLG